MAHVRAEQGTFHAEADTRNEHVTFADRGAPQGSMYDACALCGGIGQRIDAHPAQGAPCAIARGLRLQPSPDLEDRDRCRRQAASAQQCGNPLVGAFPFEKVQEDIRVGDDYSVVQGVTRLARTRLRRPVPLNVPATSSASAMSSTDGAGGSSEPSSSSATWSSRRRAQSESVTPARSAARIHLALWPAGARSSTRSSALARMPYIVRTEVRWDKGTGPSPSRKGCSLNGAAWNCSRRKWTPENGRFRVVPARP